MLTKVQIQEQLALLPEKFSIDEFIERLILISKVEKGLKQSDKKKTISEKELDKKVEKWLK